MKKNLILMLSLLIVGLFSCEKNNSIEILDEKIYTKEDQKIISFIVKNFKHSEKDIEVTEDYIFFEGDIAYPKKTFWRDYGTPNSRNHRQHNYIVTSLTNIPIYLHNVSSDWHTAIIQAVQEWNSLNGSIQFHIYPSSLNYSPFDGINIRHTLLTNQKRIAVGYYPRSSGYPGNEILINDNCNQTLDANEKKHAMVHEIGHTIGFMHTDTNAGTSITNVCWWCQNWQDPNSVMIGVLPSGGWKGFSNCDKKAFDALY